MEGSLVTGAVEQITAAQADIVTVGGAIIVLAAVVLGIRWIKAQFF